MPTAAARGPAVMRAAGGTGDAAPAGAASLTYWRDGLSLYRRAWLRLFGLALLAQYAALLPDIVRRVAPGSGGFWGGLVLTLAAAGLQALCYVALIGAIDRIARGRMGARADVPTVVLSLIVADVLYNIAVAIGLTLFLLPAVFASIVWLFFAFPIVLDGRGPLAALGVSWRRVLPRFARVSAAVSIALVVYSGYAVFTWVPAFKGIAWHPLAALLWQVQQGLVAPVAALVQSPDLMTPAPEAAPLWYFVANPLLGGLVMPAVLAALYGVYRWLTADDAAQPARSAAGSAPSAAN